MSDSPPAIPVICDRCRASAAAGAADFTFYGDLLAFEPVPLQVDRVDGWKPDSQRAFIAALAMLGSAHRAARAIGKSVAGAERLRRLPGADGFIAAWERAKALSLEKGSLRLAHTLRGVVAAEAPAELSAAPPAQPATESPAPRPVTEADRERLRAETLRRALDGTEEPVFYAGRQVGTRRVFNDRLAIYHLKSGPGGGGGASALGGIVLRGREQRIHQLLLENPLWTRRYAERLVKNPNSIVRDFPRPWTFGQEQHILAELDLFWEALRKTLAGDPARRAAYDTLFGPEAAPEDYHDAIHHAAIIFECLLPQLQPILGDLRTLVNEEAERRKALKERAEMEKLEEQPPSAAPPEPGAP